MALKEWRHWTPNGTFRIETVILLGSPNYLLWFNQVELAVYELPGEAAKSISSGEHDKTLGIPASALSVPESPEEWNGFK